MEIKMNQQSSEICDILFIFIGDILDDDRSQIPLGIAFLSGQLKKKRYSYKLLDLYNLGINFEEKQLSSKFLEELLLIYKPKAIGVSVSSYYLDLTNKFIDLLKDIIKRNKLWLPIILGGYISLIPNVLEKTNADIVCCGEGEKIIIELIDLINWITDRKNEDPNFLSNNAKHILDKLKSIQGIKFRDDIIYPYENKRKKIKVHSNAPQNPIGNLDELEFPDYDIFDFKRYNIDKTIPFYAQRGCYNHCTFCDIIPFYGNKIIRRFSPEYIIRWMKFVQNKYNIQIIDFMDDNFLNSRPFLETLFSLIEKETPLLKINFQARSSEILRFKDLISKYKQFINCIEIGTESYSYSQLKRWNKNITPLENIQANKLLSELGVSYMNFYLWLDEKTTIEELDENVDILIEQPEVPIIQSSIKIPNFIMSYEISAIYDRLGRSSVRNIPHLFACERFLNETNEIAQKINVFYTAFKKAQEYNNIDQNIIKYSTKYGLNNNKEILNKINKISTGFFQVANEIMKKRLYLSINLAEEIKNKKFIRKLKINKILSNYIQKFKEDSDKILNPINNLNIDFNN